MRDERMVAFGSCDPQPSLCIACNCCRPTSHSRYKRRDLRITRWTRIAWTGQIRQQQGFCGDRPAWLRHVEALRQKSGMALSGEAFTYQEARCDRSAFSVVATWCAPLRPQPVARHRRVHLHQTRAESGWLSLSVPPSTNCPNSSLWW